MAGGLGDVELGLLSGEVSNHYCQAGSLASIHLPKTRGIIEHVLRLTSVMACIVFLLFI
jgi:hypothetical protein